MANGRDASWFCKGMTEPQYIPEHRLAAASAAQQWNTQSKAPANPISNSPIYHEIEGCKGGRPISGSFPQSRIGCRARGGREGLDGGRWTVGGRTRVTAAAQNPRSLHRLRIPTSHFGARLPNGLGSVYSRNWKRPSPRACCVYDSYCINLPSVAMLCRIKIRSTMGVRLSVRSFIHSWSGSAESDCDQ